MSGSTKLGDVLPILTAFAGWTDEQWAEHDAKVAANIAHEREAAVAPLFVVPAWGERGWPRRALEAAAVADESRQAVQRIRAWDPGDKSVLVLSGEPGCGKTVAATWWATHSPRYNRVARFIRATTFATSSRYDQVARQFCYGAAALVLDDLGTEYLDGKGSFNVDLDELVDTFYSEERPLVITTNLGPEAFKGRYGERVADRIRECGRWMSLAEKSLRRAP